MRGAVIACIHWSWNWADPPCSPCCGAVVLRTRAGPRQSRLQPPSGDPGSVHGCVDVADVRQRCNSWVHHQPGRQVQQAGHQQGHGVAGAAGVGAHSNRPGRHTDHHSAHRRAGRRRHGRHDPTHAQVLGFSKRHVTACAWIAMQSLWPRDRGVHSSAGRLHRKHSRGALAGAGRKRHHTGTAHVLCCVVLTLACSRASFRGCSSSGSVPCLGASRRRCCAGRRDIRVTAT